MKRVVAVNLCLMMLIPVFTACSSNNGASNSQNTSEIYKTTIDEYYQAYVNADIDGMLNILDPAGPLYPAKSTIQQWRDNPDAYKVDGEIRVDSLAIISENISRAKVQVVLYMHAGSYENSINSTFELSFKDGAWLIFDATAY